MTVSASPRATPARAAAPVARLRTFGKYRRRAAWAMLLLPVVAVVFADFLMRGSRLLALPPKYVGSYSLAVVESAVLWGSLLLAGSARRGLFRWLASFLFVVLFTAAVGAQRYFHSQYSTYINLDATLFGTSFAGSVFGQLSADGKNFVQNVGPVFVVAIALLVLSRKFLRPRRRSLSIARVLAPVAVVAVFLIPVSYRRVQASTPDVIYFHALGGLIKELTGVRTTAQIRPGLRSPPVLPTLTAEPPFPRNVILLLTESVRADCHCSAPVTSCPIAPFANEAAPARMPLLQLRSNSSTTAIQLAVLWTGRAPSDTREELHSAPVLFDFAAAAGLDTAYWTSHHMMFANSRLWVQDLPTKFQCGATDIEPTADIDLGGDDMLLVERALSELPKLNEPFFANVHVGNTHVPYKVHDDHSPFQPSKSSKSEEDNEAYRNYFKNSVVLQDKAVGHFLKELRKTPFGARTVVIFTSDHGESFREHGQVGHTGSLFDEEIHVPGWIDAPPGLLTDEERKNIELRRERATFSVDVAPTILDLLGLLDSPGVAPYLPTMSGESWLRAPGAYKPLSFTNCSGVWGCAFRNWGAMKGFMKLHAREWDSDWLCFDVSKDPAEKNDLGPAACGELKEFAERVHGGLPGSM